MWLVFSFDLLVVLYVMVWWMLYVLDLLCLFLVCCFCCGEFSFSCGFVEIVSMWVVWFGCGLVVSVWFVVGCVSGCCVGSGLWGCEWCGDVCVSAGSLLFCVVLCFQTINDHVSASFLAFGSDDGF